MPIVHEDCAPEIQKRQRLERQVVSRAVKDLLAAGFYITVDYNNDDLHPNDPDGDNDCRLSRSYRANMAACGACDEEYLRCYVPRPVEAASPPTLAEAVRPDWLDYKHVGSVFLVYGNDGWDVIADYHVSLEVILTNANKLADLLSE